MLLGHFHILFFSTEKTGREWHSDGPRNWHQITPGVDNGPPNGRNTLLFWGISRCLQTVPNQATSVWRGSICVSSQTGDNTPRDRRALNGVSVLLWNLYYIGNNMKVSDIPLLDFFAKVDNLKVIHIIAVYQA